MNASTLTRKPKTSGKNAIVHITEPDRARLRGMIDAMLPYAYTNHAQLIMLQGKIADARVVPPGAVPADVITMNSQFRLQHMGTSAAETYTLVFPPQANLLEGRLSIVDFLGITVIGTRVGEIIEWSGSHEGRQLRVEELLFQPEREGCFNL